MKSAVLVRCAPNILTAFLTGLLTATLGAGITQPAEAHHSTGKCNEVGIWERADADTTSKRFGHTLETTVRVNNYPPARKCNVVQDGDVTAVKERDASQHSALHAANGNDGDCLETVAQSQTNGEIWIYGYDCGERRNVTPNIHRGIFNYGSDQMVLWMSSGGDNFWDHWYYRFDGPGWVYLGGTQRHTNQLRPWIESSGYNASSQRTTWFGGYRATNDTVGQWAPPFRCSEYEDFDRHQGMVCCYVDGDAVMNSLADWQDTC